MGKWLNAVKVKQVDASIEIERLFNEFKARMNVLNGWSEDIPAWLKKTNPELYNDWAETEYLIDERWGLEDLEGFKQKLKRYEEIHLQILKQWKEKK